jgi:hypothetical protein
MESLLQDRGGVLRLSAVTSEALPCCEAAASGIGVCVRVSCAWGHGEIRRAVGGCGGCGLHQRTTRALPARLCKRGSSAPCASIVSAFPLPTMCAINAS